MAPKPDRLALIFGMVAKLFAEATTKLEPATTVAALWTTATPFAGSAAAGYPTARHARRPFTSAASWPHDIRNTIEVTPKSTCIGPGPTWPPTRMIGKARQ